MKDDITAASNDPQGFIAALSGPVTLDEIQRVPDLLPAIKLSVDQKRTAGRFLLTGSANLLLVPGVHESLAGRVEIISLYPFTESEKEQASGAFLKHFTENKLQLEFQGKELSSPKEFAHSLAKGGYPEPIRRSLPRARDWHKQYLSSIIQRDVKTAANVRDEVEVDLVITRGRKTWGVEVKPD